MPKMRLESWCISTQTHRRSAPCRRAAGRGSTRRGSGRRAGPSGPLVGAPAGVAVGDAPQPQQHRDDAEHQAGEPGGELGVVGGAPRHRERAQAEQQQRQPRRARRVPRPARRAGPTGRCAAACRAPAVGSSGDGNAKMHAGRARVGRRTLNARCAPSWTPEGTSTPPYSGRRRRRGRRTAGRARSRSHRARRRRGTLRWTGTATGTRPPSLACAAVRQTSAVCAPSLRLGAGEERLSHAFHHRPQRGKVHDDIVGKPVLAPGPVRQLAGKRDRRASCCHRVRTIGSPFHLSRRGSGATNPSWPTNSASARCAARRCASSSVRL